MNPTGHLNSETLNALLDAELPPIDAQVAQLHLAGCHACALRVLSATQLKAATARAGQRFAPPPEVLTRLTAHHQSQQLKHTARLYTFPHLAWSVLAASIVLFAIVLGWQQVHASNTLTAELLDQHLATLSSAASPQVLSTDRHTVKPWFQGKLPFSFNLPEPTALPADTTLQGADLTYLDGQPAALLLFTIHKHEVSVFLTQRTGGYTVAPSSTHAGFTVHAATAPDLRLIAVSDVNPADLDALLRSLVLAQ
jgi:anti-sigma factor RsiW